MEQKSTTIQTPKEHNRSGQQESIDGDRNNSGHDSNEVLPWRLKQLSVIRLARLEDGRLLQPARKG